MPIPIQAIRKQAELCPGLLRDLEAAVARGRPLDSTLARIYRQHREFGSRDRRFFSALAFAWFRWRGWLAAPEQPAPPDCVLAWLLDAPDIHPAIELLAGQLPPGAVPLKTYGPLPLEEKSRMLGRRRRGPPADIEQLVPAWLADALFYPADANRAVHRRHCIQAFQVRPPTWLRVEAGHAAEVMAQLNRLVIAHKQGGVPDLSRGAACCAHDRSGPRRTQQAAPLPPETEQSKIQSDQMAAAFHPRLPQAARLPGGAGLEELMALPAVEIQDLASQCVGLACAPQSGEHWWDACAGSGGKSLHLASLMHDKGSILGTDVREHSLQEFRRRLARNRIRTIELRGWDGTAATAPDRLFDGVLADAPCSGIGTWHRNPDARWRTPPDTAATHAALQSALLQICARHVRPGGRLVYAVCTLTAAETSGVIEGYLAARPDFRLEPLPHPLTGAPTPGLVWIWPWEGACNGMFIAVLRKTA